jgi:hypothetical protein
MSKEGTQGFAEPEGGSNVSKGPFLGSCWADVGMLVRYFTKSFQIDGLNIAPTYLRCLWCLRFYVYYYGLITGKFKGSYTGKLMLQMIFPFHSEFGEFLMDSERLGDGGFPHWWWYRATTSSGQDLLRGCLVIFNGSNIFLDDFWCFSS